MTRDPFPDHAAFRRLEDIARGAYGQPVDPQPTNPDRRLSRLAKTLALAAGFAALVVVDVALIFGWSPW